MIRVLINVAMVILLAGCAAPKTVTLTNSFDPDAVAWASKKGTAKLVGSAVIQTTGGIPRTCAGRQVALVPVSTYSSERVLNIYGSTAKGYVSRQPNMERVPAYEATFRLTACDGQGAFEFDDLPAGEFFAITQVVWQAREYVVEGGVLMLRVSVEDGKTKKIVLVP